MPYNGAIYSAALRSQRPNPQTLDKIWKPDQPSSSSDRLCTTEYAAKSLASRTKHMLRTGNCAMVNPMPLLCISKHSTNEVTPIFNFTTDWHHTRVLEQWLGVNSHDLFILIEVLSHFYRWQFLHTTIAPQIVSTDYIWLRSTDQCHLESPIHVSNFMHGPGPIPDSYNVAIISSVL